LARLYVGTSSYSFREWVGPFYPPKTPASRYLSFYASKLNTVEINHTFRRFPTTELTRSWAAETPEDFRFSLKANRVITHESRLKDVKQPLRDFLSALDPLGPRLGVVLLQFPPYLPADTDRLKALLECLPREREFAFEFRHESWKSEETVDLLREFGVAHCLAEVEIGGNIEPITAPYAYVRVRRVPPYSDSEVKLLREKIGRVLERVDRLYVYIKHDEAALAPQIAASLRSGGSEE
jgi:uncharacterized protein YecE (DUF72 family)